MENLEKMLSASKQGLAIRGRWFVVQWTPNIASGEVLNIGVGLLCDDATVQVQMLDYYDRVSCLFSKDYSAQVELTCNVAREIILTSQELPIDISPQIKCAIRGRVQGSNAGEILNKLYDSIITLGVKVKRNPSKRFNPSSRDSIYNSMRDKLKTNLEINFSNHVPENPYLVVEGYSVYVPFKKDTGVATLVSAAYSDVQRVKSNLFEGLSDLDMASEKYKHFLNNGIFLLMPDESLKEESKTQIENQIDKFYWIMKQHKIYCESHTSVEYLADYISEWCLKVA